MSRRHQWSSDKCLRTWHRMNYHDGMNARQSVWDGLFRNGRYWENQNALPIFLRKTEQLWAYSIMGHCFANIILRLSMISNHFWFMVFVILHSNKYGPEGFGDAELNVLGHLIIKMPGRRGRWVIFLSGRDIIKIMLTDLQVVLWPQHPRPLARKDRHTCPRVLQLDNYPTPLAILSYQWLKWLN